MEWKDLTDSAKSVIEWIEDPFTNKRRTIEIKTGETFSPHDRVSILITEELFKEVMQYVESDKELQCEQFGDTFVFKIHDNSKLVLH